MVLITKSNGGGGGGGGTLTQVGEYTHTQVILSDTRTVPHNLGTKNVVIACYDEVYAPIAFDNVAFLGNNTLEITFTTPCRGKGIILAAGAGVPTVYSVFGRTGVIDALSGDYNTDLIYETLSRVFVSPAQRTAITHSNRTALDNVSGVNTGDQDLSPYQEIANMATDVPLNETDPVFVASEAYGITAQNKTDWSIAYAHSNVSGNPHGTTKSQVGLGNVSNVDTTTTQNITDYTDKRFVSDAEKTAITHSNRTALDNVSGVNTGDNATNSQYSGLATQKVNGYGNGTLNHLGIWTDANTIDDLAFGTADQLLGMKNDVSGYEHKSLSVGTTGTDFAIVHTVGGIAFNLPSASATARGVITTGTQSIAGLKTMIDTLTLATGTLTKAPLNIPVGVLKTTPTIGDVEADGTRMYYTGSLGVRQRIKTISFGELFEQATSITLTTAGTYYGWLGASYNAGYLTSLQDDPTSDRLLISTGGEGTYDISAMLVGGLSGGGSTVTAYLYKNNSQIATHSWTGTSANTGMFVNIVGPYVTLAAGDWLDVRITCGNNGRIWTGKTILRAVRVSR